MSPESWPILGVHNQASHFSRRLKVWIVLITLISFFAIVAFRLRDLMQRREQLVMATEQRAANLAVMVSDHLQGSFAAADAALRQIVVYSPRIGGPTAPDQDWKPVLQAAWGGLQGIGSLSVTDRSGVIRHSTIEELIGQSRSDQYLFKQLAQSPNEQLVVDTPFRSLIVKTQMLIPLGRRLVSKEGTFDGIVAATFIPEELAGFFNNVDVGKTGRIWIFHPDGYLIFGEPSSVSPIGEKVVNNTIFELARRSHSGKLRGPVAAGGPIFLSAFETIDEPDLIVAVSLSESDVLGPQRREVVTSAIAGSLMLLIVGVIGYLLFRAIDARTFAEQSLNRMIRMDSIGRFTGGVAHDFNNMLTIILGNVALLREQGAEGRCIDQIEEAARHSSELTQRLLTFASRRPLNPESLDLNDVARSLQPMIKSLIGETITLEMHISPERCCADVDRVQLESAIVNLCINARDAMPKGGILTIQTGVAEVHKPGASAESELKPGFYSFVSAGDSGTGIAADDLPRIFEPFFTTKPLGKGSGLGLSTVYGFVKQSGGDVKVHSVVGKGTTVALYFPETKKLDLVGSPTTATTTAAPHGETILIVEDEEGIRELAEVALRRLGYNVIAAADGPAALELARQEKRLDLLLTDIILPKGMDGYQVAEELTKRQPGLRVLFASGYAEQFVQTQQRDKSGVNILMKPYGSADLVAAVRVALEARDTGRT